jgi:hypothetical protein
MRLFALALIGWTAIACSSDPLGNAPSSSVRVSGVLLVAADPGLRAACVRAAHAGGFEVPCPRLVIEHRGAIGEACPQEPLSPLRDCLEDSAPSDPKPHIRDSFVYIQNDLVLDGALHLFVVGVKSDSLLRPFRVGCGDAAESTSSGPELLGFGTTWVECAGETSGMNSGHVLLRWSRGDVIYAVSLHGHTQVNRDVELAIARNIEYVGP